VLGWQTFLKSQGNPSLVLDGVFGVATEDATRAFQRAHALTADGVVGPQTLAASVAAVAKPATPAPAAATAPKVIDPARIASTGAAFAKAVKSTVLKRNSSGPLVILWQVFLRATGADLLVDAQFGVATEDATKVFQRSKNLTPDGIVGPATVAAATGATGTAAAAAIPKPVTPTNITASKWPTLRKGSTGDAVKEWQTVLVLAGYKLTVDGVFGAGTDSATRAWQTAHKLTADGIVGGGTVAALRAQPPPNVKVAGDLDFASDSPLPGIIPEAAPPLADVSPDRSLAARLALHLSSAAPGAEDRELVETFQRVKGLNPTGNYGPGTARALMRYGLVPPPPFYWPEKHSGRERREYRNDLLREANKDPQRAREWNAAASRV